MSSALRFRRAAVVVAPALSALLLLLAGPSCAQAISDGYGLLVWAATLAVLSYVLRRSGTEPAATP